MLWPLFNGLVVNSTSPDAWNQRIANGKTIFPLAILRQPPIVPVHVMQAPQRASNF